MAEYKFEGWIAVDKETGVGGMKWQQYDPKQFEETDVDIEISHCGVCGTDVHSLRSTLFPTDYPTCAGHEIVGTITKVGAKVAGGLQVGNLAGVGSQIGSCSDCEACISGNQNHCMKMVQTYSSHYPNGVKTMGGFAKYWRGPSDWVFLIPAGLSASEAAPMLCGGITLYSPLKRFGAGPGKSVGIIGIGGLGHFGILFAKALGADKVVAVSRNSKKKSDAFKLGATDFIATDEEEGWSMKHFASCDLVISTVSTSQVPLGDYLNLLKTNGNFVQIGNPTLPEVQVAILIFRGLSLSGSLIGPPAEIREMLEFAVKRDVHPLIEEKPMHDANNVITDLDKGLARYRYVLVN